MKIMFENVLPQTFSLELNRIFILTITPLFPSALSLASTEVRFHVDSETHDPIDVQTKELRYDLFQ